MDKYIIEGLDTTKIIQPIIHRENGNYLVSSTKLQYLIDNNINKDKFVKPKDLIILTVSNYKDTTLFEKSLQHLGIKDYVILGEDNIKWNYYYKIKWIYDYLNKNHKEKYVMYVDARDAIIQDDPQKILDLFLKQKDCKLLFSATEFEGFYFKRNNWWHDDVKKLLKMGNDPNRSYLEYIKKNKSNNLPVYLNSGFFIGEIEYIKNFLLHIDKNTPTSVKFNISGGDQQLITNYLPLFPEIKVDIYFEFCFRNTFRKNHIRCWNPQHICPYKKVNNNKNDNSENDKNDS